MCQFAYLEWFRCTLAVNWFWLTISLHHKRLRYYWHLNGWFVTVLYNHLHVSMDIDWWESLQCNSQKRSIIFSRACSNSFYESLIIARDTFLRICVLFFFTQFRENYCSFLYPFVNRCWKPRKRRCEASWSTTESRRLIKSWNTRYTG